MHAAATLENQMAIPGLVAQVPASTFSGPLFSTRATFHSAESLGLIFDDGNHSGFCGRSVVIDMSRDFSPLALWE
jgi:hypothetical protein